MTRDDKIEIHLRFQTSVFFADFIEWSIVPFVNFVFSTDDFPYVPVVSVEYLKKQKFWKSNAYLNLFHFLHEYCSVTISLTEPISSFWEIFAKRIKALEEDLADKAATLQEKDKIISDYALAEEKAKQDKTYANLPSTIVRAADIKEGMLLKSPTQQIQLNNITINQTQIQFTYTQNGTTQNGRLQLDAELVRLEGLGAGLCYKTEEEKVVFYLLPERGSVMRFVEE